MILVDTHTHLYSSPSNIQEQIEKAEDNSVFRFFMPNIDKETCEEVLNIQSLYPDRCYAMLGLHPVHVKEDYKEQLEIIKSYIDRYPIKAIGEIGLDLYWDTAFLESQKDAFRIQCHWASELHLPISIHSRNAFSETMDLLNELKPLSLRGIFHCFTGTPEEAERIIDYGLYLGIGGVLTYKNSTLKDSLKDIDLSHIVLETDAPYLPPVPFRGKPNQSAYLIYVAEFLANLKNCSLAEIANITTENAKRIFDF